MYLHHWLITIFYIFNATMKTSVLWWNFSNSITPLNIVLLFLVPVLITKLVRNCFSKAIGNKARRKTRTNKQTIKHNSMRAW